MRGLGDGIVDVGYLYGVWVRWMLGGITSRLLEMDVVVGSVLQSS